MVTGLWFTGSHENRFVSLNEILTSLTNMMGKMVSLINLVLLQGQKERVGEVREDIWLNMWPKWGQSLTTGKWVGVQ